MSLLSYGTVANIGDQDGGPLQGVSETMALMISFQADRQIRSVRQHQYLKVDIGQSGRGMENAHLRYY